MSLINIAKSYFHFFSNKDIHNLKKLFDKNILLKDWEISANGIDSVVETNEKIFNSIDRILVTPKKIYQDKLVLICEIEILINNSETINVVDIIIFNKNNKIIEVSAYKQ